MHRRRRRFTPHSHDWHCARLARTNRWSAQCELGSRSARRRAAGNASQRTTTGTGTLVFVAKDAVSATTTRHWYVPLRGVQLKTATPDGEGDRPQLPA